MVWGVQGGLAPQERANKTTHWVNTVRKITAPAQLSLYSTFFLLLAVHPQLILSAFLPPPHPPSFFLLLSLPPATIFYIFWTDFAHLCWILQLPVKPLPCMIRASAERWKAEMGRFTHTKTCPERSKDQHLPNRMCVGALCLCPALIRAFRTLMHWSQNHFHLYWIYVFLIIFLYIFMHTALMSSKTL